VNGCSRRNWTARPAGFCPWTDCQVP
jgi:hypothetical protein